MAFVTPVGEHWLEKIIGEIKLNFKILDQNLKHLIQISQQIAVN